MALIPSDLGDRLDIALIQMRQRKRDDARRWAELEATDARWWLGYTIALCLSAILILLGVTVISAGL